MNPSSACTVLEDILLSKKCFNGPLRVIEA